jgi:hypothetical protein
MLLNKVTDNDFQKLYSTGHLIVISEFISDQLRRCTNEKGDRCM